MKDIIPVNKLEPAEHFEIPVQIEEFIEYLTHDAKDTADQIIDPEARKVYLEILAKLSTEQSI